MTQHGLLKKGIDAKSTAFKVPSSDQLSAKRVDPSILEVSYIFLSRFIVYVNRIAVVFPK